MDVKIDFSKLYPLAVVVHLIIQAAYESNRSIKFLNSKVTRFVGLAPRSLMTPGSLVDESLPGLSRLVEISFSQRSTLNDEHLDVNCPHSRGKRLPFFSARFRNMYKHDNSTSSLRDMPVQLHGLQNDTQIPKAHTEP